MYNILLKLITFLHIAFIIFVLSPIFINSNYFLMLHAITIPFLIIHWVLGNNTCILTVAEKVIRQKMNLKVDPNDCFTCNLIEPVYDFHKNYKALSCIIYIITILTWIISIGKLSYKYKIGEITNWRQLFRIN